MGATAGMFIGSAVQGLGTGMKASAQVSAGNAAQAQAEENARLLDLQATDAITRGNEAERRYRLGTTQFISSQRAGFAGQGVDVNSGSAADTQAESAGIGELDALTIRTNAAREAWGLNVRATNVRQQGANASAEGTNAATATILGSAGDYLTKRYGFKAATA